MGRIEIAIRDSDENQNSSAKALSWRRVIPGFVVSAIVLVALFAFVDIDQFIKALQLADYRLIVLSVLVILAWLAVRTLFWRKLLRDQADFRDIFFAINEGYLLNNTLPFRLGEFGRAYLLSRRTALKFWEVLSSIAIERLLDLSFAILLLFSALPFLVGVNLPLQTTVILSVLVIFGLSSLYIAARRRVWLVEQYRKFLARRSGGLEGGSNAVIALLEGLGILTDGRLFLQALFWVTLNWALGITQYYLLIRAFFQQGTLLWAAFALAVAALGIAVPSSPGAVGVFEAAIVGALLVFDADPGISLALALVTHLLQVISTGLIGAYALARDGDSLIGLYKQIRQIWANLKSPKNTPINP
jgi:hypothetical protein